MKGSTLYYGGNGAFVQGADLPRPVQQLGIVSVDGEVYIFGGYTKTGSGGARQISTDVYKYALFYGVYTFVRQADIPYEVYGARSAITTISNLGKGLGQNRISNLLSFAGGPTTDVKVMLGPHNKQNYSLQ